MKRTYSLPACVVVELGIQQIIAESLPIGGGGGDDTIGDSDQILTKENKGVNVWDEEW